MPYDIDTKYVKYIVDGPIWEGMYKPNIPTIDLEIAKEIVRERLMLQGDKSIRLLLHGEVRVPMTDQGRKYLAGPEGRQRIAAAAILFSSWTSSAVVNFVILINAKHFPLSAFQNRQRAKQWLLKTDVVAAETAGTTKSLSQQYFDHLFNCVPLSLFVIDQDGKIVQANTKGCADLGLEKTQMLGKSLSVLTQDKDALYDTQGGKPLSVKLEKYPFPAGVDGKHETLVVAVEAAPWISPSIRIYPNPNIAKYGLTDADLKVIALLPLGLTSEDMAKLLGLSKRTVENRREVIRRKLNAENVAALIQKLNDLDLLGKNAY